MSDEQVTTIDLDDPSFQESTQYDPTQDMNARVVPPELDSKGNVKDYLIKLSIGENKAGKKEAYGASSKKGTKYIGLLIKAQVQAEGEPYHNGFVQFPFGQVSTLSFNGTNSMADLCRLLGKPMPPKLSQQDQAAYTVGLLEDNPLIPGRIQWRAYCTTCETEISQLSGEKQWPERKDSDGQVVGHTSTVDCPTCKNELNANAQIKKFFVVK